MSESRRRAHLANNVKMPLVLDVVINLVPLSIKVRLLETDDDGNPTNIELDLDEYATRYEKKVFGMRKKTKGNTALYCAPIPLTTEYGDDGEIRFVYVARKAYIIDDLKGSPMKIIDSLVSVWALVRQGFILRLPPPR